MVGFVVAAVAWLSLVGWLTAATAKAAESSWPTAQATAANAEWVPYLDPPEKPAAVCLVDSGVAVTPDTPADSPAGPIVKRLAVDGGSGEESGSNWEGMHGTRMAFVGAAPMNGWGAVGFWPGARVVSIRAMPRGEWSFPFDNYQRAVELCTKYASVYNIVAINLSLGCACAPSEHERTNLDSRVVQAHSNGLSVVAAAGNDGGAVSRPASTPGALGIAAGNESAALCSFSNRGPGVDLVAVGCDMDLADPHSGELWIRYSGGTSAAAVTASTALALLRSYRSEIGPTEAEDFVMRAARAGSGGPVLDVEALFRTARLGHLVDAAKARVPLPATALSGSAVPSAPAGGGTDDPVGPWLDAGTTVSGRLAAPRIGSILRIGRRVTVSVRNRPAGARLWIVVQQKRGEFSYTALARAKRATDTVTLRVPRRTRTARVVVRYELPSDVRVTSVAVYRRVGR